MRPGRHTGRAGLRPWARRCRCLRCRARRTTGRCPRRRWRNRLLARRNRSCTRPRSRRCPRSVSCRSFRQRSCSVPRSRRRRCRSSDTCRPVRSGTGRTTAPPRVRMCHCHRTGARPRASIPCTPGRRTALPPSRARRRRRRRRRRRCRSSRPPGRRTRCADRSRHRRASSSRPRPGPHRSGTPPYRRRCSKRRRRRTHWRTRAPARRAFRAAARERRRSRRGRTRRRLRHPRRRWDDRPCRPNQGGYRWLRRDWPACHHRRTTRRAAQSLRTATYSDQASASCLSIVGLARRSRPAPNRMETARMTGLHRPHAAGSGD